MKDKQTKLNKLSHEELLELAQELYTRSSSLEELLQVIERGKRMWESTFDAITQPVQIVNKDYLISRANLSIAGVSGHAISDYAGKKCYEAFANRDTPCENCPLKQSMETNKVVDAKLSNRVREREFAASAYPYIDEEGSQASTVIMSYRDITEENRLQQEVVQQEKMAAIGVLAGGVAHEINNPLGGILAFTQLMLRDKEKSLAVREDLKEVEKAAMRCKKIVADLLDFSRVSKQGERSEIDIVKLFEKGLPFIKGEINSLNVDFQFIKEDEIPKVLGQQDRLQQVFLNLLTNACHAMSQGGKLTVKMGKASNGGVLVQIIDDGVGISKEHQDKIFAPFFTTKEPGKGTGLGLAISYRIMREHGGNIEVSSTDKGTIFLVTFPPLEELLNS